MNKEIEWESFRTVERRVSWLWYFLLSPWISLVIWQLNFKEKCVYTKATFYIGNKEKVRFKRMLSNEMTYEELERSSKLLITNKIEKKIKKYERRNK